MRAPLLAALLALGALPHAQAAECGADLACLDVVFVVTNDPTTLGSQLVGFYAVGGAPGTGLVAAKGLQGISRPVACAYASDVCQTPTANQVPVARGSCLSVLATLVGRVPVRVGIDEGNVTIGGGTGDAAFRYCN